MLIRKPHHKFQDNKHTAASYCYCEVTATSQAPRRVTWWLTALLGPWNLFTPYGKDKVRFTAWGIQFKTRYTGFFRPSYSVSRHESGAHFSTLWGVWLCQVSARPPLKTRIWKRGGGRNRERGRGEQGSGGPLETHLQPPKILSKASPLVFHLSVTPS